MEYSSYFPDSKMIRYAILLIVIIIPLSLFVSCGDDDDEISTDGIEEIVGTWTATKATFNGIDVVGLGGGVTLVIQSSGRFTLTLQRPGEAAMVFKGKLGFDEEWLAIEYDSNPGEIEYYDINYDDNNLHIGANSEFDLDGDGVDEFVIFFLDMVK